ncbi:unnamed protein product, partial [Pleuronectes platessa]
MKDSSEPSQTTSRFFQVSPREEVDVTVRAVIPSLHLLVLSPVRQRSGHKEVVSFGLCFQEKALSLRHVYTTPLTSIKPPAEEQNEAVTEPDMRRTMGEHSCQRPKTQAGDNGSVNQTAEQSKGMAPGMHFGINQKTQ